MSTEPPVVEDRRRVTDRRQSDRRAEDRNRYVRNAAAAAVAVCGGLSIVYLFFAALGAVDLADALIATAVAVVMGMVWLGGYLVRHRESVGSEAALTDRAGRERRGF
jgi:putative flippase GtrA